MSVGMDQNKSGRTLGGVEINTSDRLLEALPQRINTNNNPS